MEPGRNRLALKWHPHRLDMVVREGGIFSVAFALLIIVGDVGFVVLIIWPLRRAPVDCRHEVVVARRHLPIGFLRGFGFGFAATSDRLEGRADVSHLFHAFADACEIGSGLVAAWAAQIQRTWLVPIDAVGADNIVEEPALLVKTLHMRLAALVYDWLLCVIHLILLVCDVPVLLSNHGWETASRPQGPQLRRVWNLPRGIDEASQWFLGRRDRRGF